MEYFLRNKFLDLEDKVTISEHDYCEIELARSALSYALSFEEKYEIVVLNYLDFEKELLGLALDSMVWFYDSYTFIPSVIRQVNRRLINLLTSIKLYQDQIKQNIVDDSLRQNIDKDKIEKLFSEEWDNNINYRFMDALRNYTQHCGLPIREVTAGGKWTSTDDNGVFESYVKVFAKRLTLELDPKFKRSVLENMSEKIELQGTTRSYMESLSNVHVKTRLLIDGYIKISRKKIFNYQELYTQELGNDVTFLQAIKMDKGNVVDTIPLLLNWDDIRQELVTKNNKLSNLSRRRIVTGAF